VFATIAGAHPGDDATTEALDRDGDRVGTVFAQAAPVAAGAPFGVGVLSIHQLHPACGQVR
jgi:hypothetical protein